MHAVHAQFKRQLSSACALQRTVISGLSMLSIGGWWQPQLRGMVQAPPGYWGPLKNSWWPGMLKLRPSVPPRTLIPIEVQIDDPVWHYGVRHTHSVLPRCSESRWLVYLKTRSECGLTAVWGEDGRKHRRQTRGREILGGKCCCMAWNCQIRILVCQ